MYLTFSHLGRLGSLGNQLFQIAATMGIGRHLGMRPVFPEWRYAEGFSLPLPTCTGLIGDLPIYREPSFTYQLPLLADSTNLVGFFQSEHYFSNARHDVREILSPSEEIRHMCQLELKSLLGLNTCSIHVRRGDYVGHPCFADLSATDYYERAMSCFPADTRFLLVSDDLKFCRRRFRDRRVAFIEGEDEVVDLCIMTLCKSHIIANSSYSWWGAWLNPYLNKKVIAPKRWFDGPFADPDIPFSSDPVPHGFHDTRDLIPATWTRI